MKNIIYFITLFLSFLSADRINAQVACICHPSAQWEVDPNDSCCHILSLYFAGSNCPPITMYDKIIVNTYVFGGTGTITSAVGQGPFSATVLHSTLAEFSTSPGFIPSTPQVYEVGRVCFANVSTGWFYASVTITNAQNICSWEYGDETLTTYCIPDPPCLCKPQLNLIPDPEDECCYYVGVDFPNPAACTLPTNFDQVELNIYGTATILGSNGLGGFTSTTTPTQALFTSSSFINPVSQSVGRICFEDFSTSPFTVAIEISNSTINPDPCRTGIADTITTTCLKPCAISIRDSSACTTDPVIHIPLIGCNTLPAGCNVSQVKWYIQSPCNVGPWTLYQVNPDCSDLVLLPSIYSDSVCVYAELYTDGNCICPQPIVSNTATIQLCEPIGCSIQNNNPEFCDCGIPNPITVMPSSASSCFYSVVWYDGTNAIVGNSNSYSPPQLCFTAAISDCYQDYTYKAVITSICGKDSCMTSFRVYNSLAPHGTLIMDPVENQPFCPGEDATLKFTPGCAGSPKMWDWYVGPCVPPLQPTHISTAGNMNQLFNTNKLFESAYYYVVTQNGACPKDTVSLLIEVKDSLMINSFTAIPDPCVEQQVDLTLNFKPCTITGCLTGCNCSHTVDWYKDGYIIGSNTWPAPGGVAMFTYTGPAPFYGNYYAVLKDDCCVGNSIISPLVQIAPTCFPKIDGPCFMCNGMPITLFGEMILPPRFPCPDFCTFQWYFNGGPIPGATSLTLIATQPGTYTLVSDCNGCIRSDSYTVVECFNNCSCTPPEIAYLWQLWGPVKIISANNTSPVIAPCPDFGNNFNIFGALSCNVASCGNNTVNWVLDRPGNLSNINGVSNQGYPVYVATIPSVQCSQPGVYKLTVTRNCGLVPCTVSYSFEVNSCPCRCLDLSYEAGLGFSTGGSPINCAKYFRPNGLDNCDVVSWSVNGTVLPGSSIGNNKLYYTFASPGSYTVCMTVTRTDPGGTICTFTKCQTIQVNCGFQTPYGYCTKSAVLNGHFLDGIIAGQLGNGASIADWKLLPLINPGLVFVDDSAGGFDDGYIVMMGNTEKPSAIYQEVEFISEPYTIIEYNRRNFSGSELPEGTKLEFRLQADTSQNSEYQVLYTDLIESTEDTGWVAKSLGLPIIVNPEYRYLVITLVNDDPSENLSAIGLDNLEICSSPTTGVEEIEEERTFRLFPNPASHELTIEWDIANRQEFSIEIVDNLGRIVSLTAVPDDRNSTLLNVSSLPDGLYFVKILSAGKPLKVLKFVKS